MAHQLSLTADIDAALERGIGPLGQLLRVINAYERGDLAQVAATYTGGDLTGTVMDAMSWSTRTVRAFQEPAER